ncbi:TonB-dependent receptor [Flavitalea antarctica]
MRLTLIQIFLVTVFSLHSFAHDIKAQEILNKKISLNVDNAEIKKLLKIIEKNTGASFVYAPDIVKSARKVSVFVEQKRLGDVLNEVFASVNINYAVEAGNIIVLYPGNDPGTATSPATFDRPVSGKVTDVDGKPLDGVSVMVKGSSRGTTTGADGTFRLQVADDDEYLVFSRVGYTNREEKINGNVIEVKLAAGTLNFDEVIVVGYGKQRKVTNVGAQSSISTKELVQSPVANISNSLVGRMPGLFAIQSSGEPGADASRLLIRGIGTFAGTGAPLILVDGIQVDNYNNIDPNEIESITILKDASSTAVYGVRGANGVIIITTKRGRTGTPVVSYTFNNAFNSFTALRQNMNSFDYATAFNQAIKNDTYVNGNAYTPRFTDNDLKLYQDGTDPVFHPNMDWWNYMTKDVSTQQQHNLSIRGGSEKVRYFISAGMFNQSGLFNNTEVGSGFDAQIRYKRYNFRSNFNFDITPRLKAALDLSTQVENRTGNAASTTGIINRISTAAPFSSPGILDEKIVTLTTSAANGDNGSNPVTGLYTSGYKNDVRNFINTSLRLDYDLGFITPGLSTHGIIAYQTANRKINSYNKPLVTYIARTLPDNSVIFAQQADEQPFSFTTSSPDRNRRITGEFALDYRRSFNGHSVTGLLLYNQIKTHDPSFAFSVPNGYQSVVGRVAYDYQGRYLLEYNASYTGTENFAPGQRFGFFPAYSVGWVPSSEKFFPKNNVITFLKFRGSYGEVGNDQLSSDFLYNSNSRFLYRPTAFTPAGNYYWGVVGSNYAAYPGLREGRVNNPGLTWERAIKTNIGMEVSLFRSKVSIVVDAFREQRDNILATPQSISALAGVTPPAQNLGKMDNQGIEGEITYRSNYKRFNYWVKGNMSFARNKVIFQDEVPKLYAYQNRTGNRFGQLYGLIAEGLYNSWEEANESKRPVSTFTNVNRLQPGDIKYRDVNGDGLINTFDEVPIGDPLIPEITYGLSFGGNIKGFDFSVLFQGADKVSIQYSRRANQAFHDADPAAAAEYLKESWSPERYAAGLPINFPRLAVGNGANGFTHNYVNSTYWIVDGQYLRLKNAEIGYTFSQSFLRKVGIKTARFYVNANNLITWSGALPGIDPETPNLGANNEPYPLVRTVNTGVNITF